MDRHHNILQPDGSNYSSWSNWMIESIFDEELWELVSSSETKPAPQDPDYRKLIDNWESSNSLALSLILKFVHPSIKKRMEEEDFKSAENAWDYLASWYDYSTLIEKKFVLEMHMKNLLQDGRDFKKVYKMMVKFWERLTVDETEGLKSLDRFKLYQRERRLVQLLLPLRSDYVNYMNGSLAERSIFPSVAKSFTDLLALVHCLFPKDNHLSGLISHFNAQKLNEMYWLEIQIRCTKQNERSIYDLFEVMSDLWDRLVEMEPEELRNLDCFKKFREEYQLVQFLLALRRDFDTLRRSILQGSKGRSFQEALGELIFEERRLKSSNCGSLIGSRTTSSFEEYEPREYEPREYQPRDYQPRVSYDVYSNRINRYVQLKSDDSSKSSLVSELDLPPTKRYGFCPCSDEGQQPSSSSSGSVLPLLRPSTHGKPMLSRDIDNHLSMVRLVAQIEHDFFGKSPLESACCLPDFVAEGSNSRIPHKLKILSYNIWFRNVELDHRMTTIGNLIQLHSPDVICFQEVTPNIYDIFKQSVWWKDYNCSISDEIAGTRRYFCILLSKLPARFSCMPFKNSKMRREICFSEIEIPGNSSLIVVTSHLESPTPPQMNSELRVAQAKEAMELLGKSLNVIFGGDMNWIDNLDGKFPLPDGWVDAWEKLRPSDDGWTYDTKTNPMLFGNRPVQKRLDRFVCRLSDFDLVSVEMVGTEAISGISYCNKKKGKNNLVLPSDHYGLLLTVKSPVC